MTERLTDRYSQAPLMIYWEMTRACDLACRHCRAEAVAWRDPEELSTADGYRLLEALSGFGVGAGQAPPGPHLVFTGGDALKRPDLYAMIARAIELGFEVAITPSGTPLLTQEAVARLQASGIRTIALSLDGSSPERHDHIRGVAGSFERTAAAARWVKEAGLGLQINSLVCAETADDLPSLYQLVLDLGANRWSVFFLIGVGRGAVLNEVSPQESEAILEWLHERSLESRLMIKTTEAHHFRRIALQRGQGPGARGQGPGAAAPPHVTAAQGTVALRHGHGPVAEEAKSTVHEASTVSRGASPTHHSSLITHHSSPAASIRRGFGIRDGAGIMFISHTGEVCPAGFLPLSVGNVKTDDPVRLYREAPLFVQLRDPAQLKGKCGRCEFRVICGGSRSRAWAATGDPLEADPLCVYEPRPASDQPGAVSRELASLQAG